MSLVFGTSFLLVLVIAEVFFLTKVKGKHLPWKEIVANVNSGHIMSWLVRGAVLIAYQSISSNLSFHFFQEIPEFMQWVLVVFVWDFFFYWSHRMHHEILFLWKIHSVHHQPEHFNLSVGIRNSWYQALTSFPFFVILAVMGVSIEQFLMVSTIHYVIQFYNHNAIVKKSGFLEKIIMTPSTHRVHHGKNKEYLNKNHGGTFIFWDKLFGTFQLEREDIQIEYGNTDTTSIDNPFWANLVPILQYLKVSVNQEGVTKRIINIKDRYIVIGSLLLFLLLLVYINNEQEWAFPQLANLFLLVFGGTIALGSVSNGQKIGLISWVVISVPGVVGFLWFFEVNETLLLSVLGMMVIHGLVGVYNLVKWSYSKMKLTRISSRN